MNNAEKWQMGGVKSYEVIDPTPQTNTTTPEQALSQSALFSACKMIEEFTGTCPADPKDWEHPDGCANHCDSGCEINCWKTYFISENERINHE